MIIGIGVDIVEIHRIRNALRGTQRMQERVFTEEEIQFCTSRKRQYQHFGGRFAAKEAALKALGTGWSRGIRWKEVEITDDETGKPILTFHGKAKEIFEQLSARTAWISITHSPDHAVAMVILEK
jgi:holo-[acyl-carrier protein] synthase